MNKEDFLSVITALLMITALLALIVFLVRLMRRKDYTKMYCRKDILTGREYGFYCSLAPLAEEYGLHIFTKVRLADLIEPKEKKNRSVFMECFNKIKAKHIDFALADDEANIIMLIELDDSTHSRPDRQERDIFVDAVLANTGYLLMRTYGELDEIELALDELLY